MTRSASVLHVSATESRTLCGSLALAPRSAHAPFDQWLDAYTADREQTCLACRSACMRYSDRFKLIRSADVLYYASDDTYPPHA